MSENEAGWNCVCSMHSSADDLQVKGGDGVNDRKRFKFAGGLRRKGCVKSSRPLKPLITVITVVLNRKNSIERTIKSVIGQSYDNIEYIIIDGGSNDGTLETIRKYENSIDLWISEADNGVYDAMNKGAKAASGDWLVFLNSDDILLDTLHNVVSFLKKDNEIYYGDVYMIHRHKLYDGKFSAYDLMKRSIPHPATFYPNKIFAKYSYDLKYKIAADYHLNIRCYNDKEFTFVYMPLLVAIYDDVGGISAQMVDSEFEHDLPAILMDNFGKTLYYQYVFRKVLKNFERNTIRKITHLLKNSLIRTHG